MQQNPTPQLTPIPLPPSRLPQLRQNNLHPVAPAVGLGDFGFYKLEIENIWLVDFYGGAAAITPAEYYNATILNFLHKSPNSAH